MFATKELVTYRKREATRLQAEIKTKLLQVQKLVIKRLLKGEKIVFEISSYAKAAMMHDIDGIHCGHKYYQVNFEHYDHMDYDYDNCICEFYLSQIEIVKYWIRILKD